MQAKEAEEAKVVVVDDSNGDEEYISMEETMRLLGIKRSTLDKWIAAGKITRYKQFGGKYNLFKKRDVLNAKKPRAAARDLSTVSASTIEEAENAGQLAVMMSILEEQGLDVAKIAHRLKKLRRGLTVTTKNEDIAISLVKLLGQYPQHEEEGQLNTKSQSPTREDLLAFFLLGYERGR